MSNAKHVVLVIDDDAQVLGLLRRFIEANNGLALLAENTEAGLVLARSGTVDIVLLDIVLPDENGVVALRKIKACLPEVPVIMMTGFDEMDKARHCLANGACDFITKPLDFEYLKTSMLANLIPVSGLDQLAGLAGE
jgi:DNA-binding NtrC family response regulator